MELTIMAMTTDPTPTPTQTLTLDEFVRRSAAAIEAFAAATRAAQAEGADGFTERRHTNLTEADWWAEVAAYAAYVEIEEVIATDRRQAPTVERRRRAR